MYTVKNVFMSGPGGLYVCLFLHHLTARRVLLRLCTDGRCEQSQSLSSDLQDYLEHQDMKIQDLKRDVAQAQTHVTRLTRQAEFKDEQLQRCTQQLHSLNSKVRRRPAAVTSWPPAAVTSWPPAAVTSSLAYARIAHIYLTRVFLPLAAYSTLTYVVRTRAGT